MSVTARLFAGIAICFGAYFAFVSEAAAQGPNVLPHWPMAFLIWVAWSFPVVPGIAAAACIGFGCDLVGSGPLGPGVIAATVIAFFGGGLRRRWGLQSVLSLALFAFVAAWVFLVGREWGLSLLEHRPFDRRLMNFIAAARAVSTAAVACLPCLIAGCLAKARRLVAAI
jgi:rod shape-determining protein MreD